jgi:hypothetical protein
MGFFGYWTDAKTYPKSTRARAWLFVLLWIFCFDQVHTVVSENDVRRVSAASKIAEKNLIQKIVENACFACISAYSAFNGSIGHLWCCPALLSTLKWKKLLEKNLI